MTTNIYIVCSPLLNSGENNCLNQELKETIPWASKKGGGLTMKKIQKKKLLLVEDDKEFRETLEIMVEDAFEIDTAGSMEKALKLLQENKYDVVSIDGSFPEYEGRENDGEYRGDIVAKAAKQKGSYVVGLSSEPKKLKEPHIVLCKWSTDASDYEKALKGEYEKKR